MNLNDMLRPSYSGPYFGRHEAWWTLGKAHVREAGAWNLWIRLDIGMSLCADVLRHAVETRLERLLDTGDE